MAKPNKAQITYLVGEATSTLRFHSVIAEEHEASSRLTKFPIQSGFMVSNHAITENRKISIKGVVSNHVILGAEESHTYGGNNSRVMFSTLNSLVRQKTPCDVVTNYGDYKTVIFTKMRTKLVAGKTDVMEFQLSGEEVQVGTAINDTTPTLLVFTPLTDAERAAEVDRLAKVGVVVPPEAVVSTAPVDVSGSFQVESTATNGKAMTSTWEIVGYDPTTNQYTHNVHTSDVAVAIADPTAALAGINWFQLMREEADFKVAEASVSADESMLAGLPDIDLAAGASTAGACLLDGLVGIGLDLASDAINTAVGELTKSIYGAIYGVQSLGGDSELGQMLVALGLDCLIAGAIGTVDPTLNEEDYQDNSIPTWEQALEGAAKKGDGVATSTLRQAAPTTLTKISPPNAGVSFFGDLL